MMYRRGSLVLNAAKFAIGFIRLFLVLCIYKVLRKCVKKCRDEEKNDDPKSRATGDSERSSSEYEGNDTKWNANEGFQVDETNDCNAKMGTFSRVDRNGDGQVPRENQESAAMNEANLERQNTTQFGNSQSRKEGGEIGCTRFNSDGSMDTRF